MNSIVTRTRVSWTVIGALLCWVETATVAFARDEPASVLAEMAAADYSRPVRPVGVNGQVPWNWRSAWFLYAPTFGFTNRADAASYRFVVTDAKGARHSFTAKTAQAPLSPVWTALPIGWTRVVCEALDGADHSLGVVGTRDFGRQAPFCGTNVLVTADAAERTAGKIVKAVLGTPLAKANYLSAKGVPKEMLSPENQVLVAYPSKMGAALLKALAKLSGKGKPPSSEALELAGGIRDKLFSLTEEEGTALAGFPRTYDDHPGLTMHPAKTVREKGDRIMLVYPAEVGDAYLSWHEVSGDGSIRAAAVRIAERYLALQGEDGTWPLNCRRSDGTPAEANRLVPIGVMQFLEHAFAVTRDARYRAAADRAFAYVERHLLSTWNWEGQFEDSIASNGYFNLTEHGACDTALYLLKRYPEDAVRISQAREMLRFSEDQFVCWETPLYAEEKLKAANFGIWGEMKTWRCPGVLEQYQCYVPIDSSAAKLILTYLALYRAERNPLDLAKARALGGALVRETPEDGNLPTFWFGYVENWPNCTLSSAAALSELAAHIRASGGKSVEPAAVFSAHAVLLRSADTPVFGFAEPGERVRVSIGSAAASGVANEKGEWLVRLDLTAVGEGPFVLRINERTIPDVMVGEVWLCSGQSNMAFRQAWADDAEAESSVTNRRIRCFLVDQRICERPCRRISGRWVLNEPDSTGLMSAVGYHFAKAVQRELGTPLGFLQPTIGAATLEAWSDPATMASDPDGKRELDRQIAFMASYRDYEDRCDAALREWESRWQRSDREHGTMPVGGWRSLRPDELKAFGCGPGAVWFKRSWKAGEGMRFVRRRFIETQWVFDTSSVEVYWNGRRIARSFPDDPIEKNTEWYEVPQGEDGELAVRLFNAESVPDVLQYFFRDDVRLPREGWSFAAEYSLPPVSPEARAAMPPRQAFCLRQHWPTGLYNGMIAGLVPMGLSGVLWYQGESNAPRADVYAPLFKAFIKSWRQLFRKPELPFAWCQLAAFQSKSSDPNPKDVSWPRLREAQTQALELPMTGQAVLIDAGEEQDIHPRDKRTPGRRLADWALNRVYGRTSFPYASPQATNVRVSGNEAVVAFGSCDGGLKAADLGDRYPRLTAAGSWGKVVRNSPDAQVEGFSLAGRDGVWHWADAATIEGTSVRVSAKAVPHPVAVRYGWAANPWVNLQGATGLPATPFEMSVKKRGCK